MHRTILAALCGATVLSALELPPDRLQAAAMLADGELDSAVWIAVNPYYTEPINVPDGDLPALAAVLPALSSVHLPSEAHELAVYEPWSPRDVQRFLLDHPYLAGIVPILSFEPRSGRRDLGWVSLRLRGTGAQMASSQYVAAFLVPHRAVQTKLRFRRDDDVWTFQRRLLRFRLGAAGDIVAGDFLPRLDNGLLGGRFEPVESAALEPLEQFLYGASRGYNGVLWRWGRGSRACGELFSHWQPSLRAFGGTFSAHAVDWLGMRAGVAGYTVVGTRDSSRLAANLGLTLGRHACRAVVDCSVPVVGGVGMALRAQVSHHSDGNSIRAEAVSVSSAYPGRWGSTSAWIADDNGNPQGRTGFRLRLCTRLFELIQLNPELSYICGQGPQSCRASVSLSGERPFEYRIAYNYQPDIAASGSDRHSVRCRFERFFGPVFGAGLHCRWYARQAEYWSLSMRAAATFRTAIGAWEPCISVRRDSESGSTYAAGLRQQTRIADFATGVLTVESPIGREEQAREQVEVHVAIRLAL